MKKEPDKPKAPYKGKRNKQYSNDDGKKSALSLLYWQVLIIIAVVSGLYAFMAKYCIFRSGYPEEVDYGKEKISCLSNDKINAMSGEKGDVPLAFVDNESLSSGKATYIKNCTVCHLLNGQGLVGPNLTDEYWIHGGDFEEIIHTIAKGVPVKGMIPWETQLSEQSIYEVGSYVTTLRGTDPPNQKEPQGEKYPEAQ
ncbi:MAG: c-type cytochrome [Bacteroidales bacterium]|jgi:cytochrome c oxidase cbb3-type subunit 3